MQKKHFFVFFNKPYFRIVLIAIFLSDIPELLLCFPCFLFLNSNHNQIKKRLLFLEHSYCRGAVVKKLHRICEGPLRAEQLRPTSPS